MKGRVVMLVQVRDTRSELAWSFACIQGVYRVERVRGTYHFVVCAVEDAVSAVEALPGIEEVDVCRVRGDGDWEVPW